MVSTGVTHCINKVQGEISYFGYLSSWGWLQGHSPLPHHPHACIKVDYWYCRDHWGTATSCKHSQCFQPALHSKCRITLVITEFSSQFRYLLTCFLAVLGTHKIDKLIFTQMQTSISLHSSDSQAGGFKINTDVQAVLAGINFIQRNFTVPLFHLFVLYPRERFWLFSMTNYVWLLLFCRHLFQGQHKPFTDLYGQAPEHWPSAEENSTSSWVFSSRTEILGEKNLPLCPHNPSAKSLQSAF